jgi:hypothetical protein
MNHRISVQVVIPFLLLSIVVGCSEDPQAKYDAALNAVERSQARLDNLRPAYDAARQKAALVVCKEIAGATPEESAMGALSQLDAFAAQAIGGGTIAGDAAVDPGADGESATTDAKPDTKHTTPPVGDADAALDQLLNAHKSMQEQQAVMAAPMAKAYETMRQINTPGTPEAKRVEEVLATMPEAKAYLRQEERLARAEEALDAAEAQLPAEPAGPNDE